MSETATASQPVRTETWMLRAMALGFGVGAALFAVGTVMLWLDASVVTANVTYAVGAVCFTTAAAVQWRAAVWRHPDHQRLWVRAETDWRNTDWSSAVVQLVGTLAFNVMTIRAVVQAVGDPQVTNADVWRPDAVGSILFLVSSGIAWHPVARQRRHHLVARRSVWICGMNLLGSVLFGVSAWGASLLADNAPRSTAAANWGTFTGALAFLAAAALLWPGSQASARQGTP